MLAIKYFVVHQFRHSDVCTQTKQYVCEEKMHYYTLIACMNSRFNEPKKCKNVNYGFTEVIIAFTVAFLTTSKVKQKSLSGFK